MTNREKVNQIEKNELENIVSSSNSWSDVYKKIDIINASYFITKSLQERVKIEKIDISHFHTKKEFQKDYIELIKVKCGESNSYYDLMKNLNLAISGSTHKTLKTIISRNNIDVKHFKGNAWNKFNFKNNIDVFLVKDKITDSSFLKKRLIQENILKNECSRCGINNWLGEVLSLHLDHINGEHSDNRIENLRLLCPNCHSLTPTYCVGNRKSKKSITLFNNLCKCGKNIKRKSKQCLSCYHESTKGKEKLFCRKIINRPSKEQLLEDLRTMSYVSVGKKYGVSDNAIRKWLK